MSVAPATTRAPSASNPRASSRWEGRAYMRTAHAPDVCMQMIEPSPRFVKDRRLEANSAHHPRLSRRSYFPPNLDPLLRSRNGLICASFLDGLHANGAH